MAFKHKKSNKLILSDKIADALTIKPRADIEDDQIYNTKPITVSRDDFSSSGEDEAVISDFRKQNVNLLSDINKKYEGKVVSKRDIESEVSESDSEVDHGDTNSVGAANNEIYNNLSVSDDVSDDYSITKVKKNYKQEESDVSDKSDDDTDEDDDEIDDEFENEEEGIDISQLQEPVKEEFEHVKKQNVSEEAKKGICVRNQLLLWEGLLEMRIHLQRCMNTANKMPLPDTYDMLRTNIEFSEESSNTISNVSSVLEKMLTLQNIMFMKFPETKSINLNQKRGTKESSVQQESDEEIPSDTDNEEIPSDTDAEDNADEKLKERSPIKQSSKKQKVDEYESDISTCHKAFKSYRDSTIQKWNEKTRVASAMSVKNAPTNTVLQQISYILSDMNKLRKRTQLKRSDYDIIGYKKLEEHKEPIDDELNVIQSRKDDDEYITEIFDDSDFYHQLLRELIECKSADVTDPIQLSRQWIALQQMRSKMKRKVDTKATKGRKIKYVVHNKLVSFMAPEKSKKWTDESTSELYSSLFGKMFEQNNVGLNIDLLEKN
ncbi:protein AATF [Leptidea sinapis]|uniref:protein AATF n=1 Tax=Leptidea sinapis TaxID=189913 RepID=UPI0021218479|nr:protein AATF [Leptidea sinapis]